jgi:hypothetical protein
VSGEQTGTPSVKPDLGRVSKLTEEARSVIKFLIALLFLLVVALLVGVVRKLRGGTLLPPDGPVLDRKTGQWKRRNENEEAP